MHVECSVWNPGVSRGERGGGTKMRVTTWCLNKNANDMPQKGGRGTEIGNHGVSAYVYANGILGLGLELDRGSAMSGGGA